MFLLSYNICIYYLKTFILFFIYKVDTSITIAMSIIKIINIIVTIIKWKKKY